jgi:purine-nucleoside phosphorylase
LGDLADLIENPIIIPYSKIPGFPTTNVVGHKGNLVFGKLGGKYVMCQQGRFHPYEHEMDLALCSTPVRIMHLLGVKTLIVSNAAGGVNPAFMFGDLMLLKDHIFMPGNLSSH